MPDIVEPVSRLAQEHEREVEEGVGLAISGGGYRAMLFHLGSFLRLHELGMLKEFKRISSVSGGSITSAKIALEWAKLDSRDDFLRHVVIPIRNLAGITLDVRAGLGGIFLPGTIAEHVAKAYRKHLFGDATLQDLPDGIRFVINATNVETGTLWRFSKPYMRDYRVGKVADPKVPLADAVAASSAFPPVLSPMVLRCEASDFTEVADGVTPGFLEEISLTDGGVYDSLGLETVWKRYKTVLVSDAGGKNAPDPSPASDWAFHAKRVLDIIHEQVSSVRKRQVIADLKDGGHEGAYWGIRTDISHYGLADALPAPRERTLELAETPTRLKRLSALHQERLINWGYAVCDAAVRKHCLPEGGGGAAPAFPYPQAGV